MTTNLDKYRKDLAALIALGDEMRTDLALRSMKEKGTFKKEHKEAAKTLDGSFERNYQRWYTEASAVVRQLIPDRLDEFQSLYRGDPKRKEISSTTYSVQDWLNGVRARTDSYRGEKPFDDFAIVVMRFQTQMGILRAVESRFTSSLFDIRQLVQADLFDSELEAARELKKNGFLRGAGAMAGVVLEKHLAQVCSNHAITTRKQHPTISDFNDLLKNGGVLDVPGWRQLQRLGDLRNLCDHNKHREPTAEEIEELVSGVEKITKTLY
jgi:hypothetical protein